MARNRSQKLDIEDICDAVVNSIDGKITELVTAATTDDYTAQQMALLEQQKQLNENLREITFHLRIITGESPTTEDLS